MTLSDRIAIESGLHLGHSFKQIAKELKRHPSTISHEVKTNRVYIAGSYYHGNDCRKARKCRYSVKHLCGDNDCSSSCSICWKHSCHEVCDKYVPCHCSKPDFPPYVCNCCAQKKLCTNERYIYSAKNAQAYYDRRLSESRKGIRISPEDREDLDQLLTRLVSQGQPLAHIYAHHADEMPVSLRSLYNYIESGKMTIRNIDLRRKTTYRKRKRSNTGKVVNEPSCRVGRTYDDFLKYMETKDPDTVTEMDTVIGHRGGGNRLLTMIFRRNSVMLVFLLPNGKADSVKRVFDWLEYGMGYDAFARLFPVILTDNGSEFKRADDLELTEDHELRTRLFYCDPQAAWQKPRIEKNHEFIRYVIPKGKSFNGYTQADMTLLADHINSVKRPNLGFKSPYDLVRDDDDMNALMKLLKMHPIPPDEVRLKSDIFKKI